MERRNAPALIAPSSGKLTGQGSPAHWWRCPQAPPQRPAVQRPTRQEAIIAKQTHIPRGTPPEREDGVRKAYAKASKSAQQWVESDELENYARALELAERRHRLK